jgi:hypothetical protein
MIVGLFHLTLNFRLYMKSEIMIDSYCLISGLKIDFPARFYPH